MIRHLFDFSYIFIRVTKNFFCRSGDSSDNLVVSFISVKFCEILWLVTALIILYSHPTPILASENDDLIPLSLILDYMPNIVYSDEPITFCLRIANPSHTSQKIELHFCLLDSKGETLWQKIESGEAKPQNFLSIETRCDISNQIRSSKTPILWQSRDRTLALRVSLYIEGSEKEQDSFSVRIVSSDEDLPSLKLTSGVSNSTENTERKGATSGLKQSAAPPVSPRLRGELKGEGGRTSSLKLSVRRKEISKRFIGNLFDDQGNLVVLQIEHHAPKASRKWAWIRWVYQQMHKEKIPRGLVLVLGEELTIGGKKSYIDYLKQAKEVNIYTIAVRSGSNRKTEGASLSLNESTGVDALNSGSKLRSTPGVRTRPSEAESERFSKPILKSIVAFQKNVLDKRPKLSVIVLGAEDIKYGTDVLEFRKALEFIIQRLARHGCNHIVLVSPIVPPYSLKRARLYEDVIHKLANIYRLRISNLRDKLGNEIWIKECEVESVRNTPKIFTAYPIPSGHRKMAKQIIRLINEFFKG